MSIVTALPRLFAASSKAMPSSSAVSLVKLVNWNSVSCSSKVCSNESYSPMLLPYLHNRMPARSSLENAREGLRQFLKANLMPDVAVKLSRLVVSCQPTPDLAPQLHRAEDGIDAEQINSAQNKGEDACAEIDPAGVTKGRDRTAVLCGADQVGQG